MLSKARTFVTSRVVLARMKISPPCSSLFQLSSIEAVKGNVTALRSFSSLETTSSGDTSSGDQAKHSTTRKIPGVNPRLLSLLKQQKDKPMNSYELWDTIQKDPDFVEKVKSRTRMKRLLKILKKKGKRVSAAWKIEICDL